MKAVTIQEAQGQLGQLIAEACRGEVIVLTDGDKQVTLEPGVRAGFGGGQPGTGGGIVEGGQRATSPLREGELREIADRALQEHRAKRQQ